jgi:hypothetical protein
MAKKKKHKITEHERIRLEQAQHRKEFLGKLQIYCDDWGGKGTYALFPQRFIESVYETRFYSFKLDKHKDSSLTVHGLRKTKKIFSDILKSHTFSFIPGKKEISFDDFITVGFTIHNLTNWCNVNDEHQDWAPVVAERLSKAIEPTVFGNAIEELQKIITNLLHFLSAIEKWILCISYTSRQGENGLKGIETIFEINAHKAIIKHFTLNGEKRPAYQVMWCSFDEFSPFAQIKPSLFNVTTENDDPLDVYIQSHALLRLHERIDCIISQSIQIGVYSSIQDNPKVLVIDKQKALLEYRIAKQKLGYLVCEYVDNVIFIRTFLFITNNGTPEGKKLFDLTGLGKLDKKYLELDKLSSYIKSDIGNNELLKTLFTEAGCECLLHIDPEVESKAQKQSRQSFASHITQYLKKDSETFDFFDEVDD